MKIGEARQNYNVLLKSYNMKKWDIHQQQMDLQEKMKKDPENDMYKEQSVILQLSYDALDEKQSEYQAYMDKLLEQETSIIDKIAAEQQGEAMEEYAKDIGKIMEVARRIMKGHKVPAQDEKKLMEFDDKLYQAAKNIGNMVKLRKRKEYDSLWDDEEKKEQVDALEEAEETEAFANGPAEVSVEDTLASVEGAASVDAPTDI